MTATRLGRAAIANGSAGEAIPVPARLFAITGVVGVLPYRQPHGVPGLLNDLRRPINRQARPSIRSGSRRVDTSMFLLDERATIPRRPAELAPPDDRGTRALGPRPA